MSYCNIIGITSEKIDDAVLEAFCLKSDPTQHQVTGSWWAIYHPKLEVKCNLWLNSYKFSNFCPRPNLILLIINLTDLQAIKELQKQLDSWTSVEFAESPRVAVLGMYSNNRSALIEDQKIRVLEWLVEFIPNATFVPVDIQADIDTLIEIWEQIISYGIHPLGHVG